MPRILIYQHLGGGQQHLIGEMQSGPMQGIPQPNDVICLEDIRYQVINRWYITKQPGMSKYAHITDIHVYVTKF